MSFKRYALTAVFAATAATVGAGGVIIAEDQYMKHEMATGQPCDVYKNVTKWMDRSAPKTQDPNGTVSAVNYSEEQVGQAKVCSVNAGSGQGKDLAEFVHKFKGLFQ